MCMCTVYIYYVYIYKYTHPCIYFIKKIYILNIFIYNITYMNRNVNIFKIDTVRVFIYIYIINIHKTHIYYAKKGFLFCMQLIPIIRLTALYFNTIFFITN